MKKKLGHLSSLLCLCISIQTAPVNAQVTDSYWGHAMPINGSPQSVRVMMVYVEITGIAANANTDWAAGSIPLSAPDYLDASFSNSPQGYISKYFWEASFGTFKVEGDYVSTVVQVPYISNLHDYVPDVLVELKARETATTLSFGTYTSLNEFDHYGITGVPHFTVKSPNSNTYVDAVIICYRNHPKKTCASGSGCTEWAKQPNDAFGTYGIDVGCDFGMCAWGNRTFIIEEFFHSIYGDNVWHTGASGGRHTFSTSPGAWGIANQSSSGGMSNIVDAWDRDFCGWYGWSDLSKTTRKNDLIMAKDPVSSNDVVTDFQNIQSYPGAMEFVLRDFVTYGDAIRIKLPHINCLALGDTKNQYLWLENHQLLSDYDHSWGEGNGCKEPWLPGIYSYLQIGKDIKHHDSNSLFKLETYSSSFISMWQEPNGLGSWLFPLTAEGNYDFQYGAPLIDPQNCIWGNKTVPIDKFSPNTLPNPLTGASDVYDFFNTNGDNMLSRTDDPGNFIYLDEYQPWLSEKNNVGTVIGNAHNWGDSEDAFNFITGKTKLSISTNPTPTPVFTYTSDDGMGLNRDPDQPKNSYENRTVWLNGISMEVIQENYDPNTFGPGAVKVRIRFDDYDVDRDTRWCASGDDQILNAGGIKLSPNDFNSTLPSLTLKQNKTIHLDRGRSFTHVFAQGTDQSGNFLFTLPTLFTCLPYSYILMEDNTKIIVDNGSTLKLQDQSKIILQAGSQIIVRNNSKLILESGSLLQLNSGAKVIIEDGSTIEYYPNAEIQLNGVYSSLEIAGLLDLKDYSDFTFTYNTNLHGYVLFNSPQSLPLNIHAGINCTMNFNGSNQLRKVLEVAQEGLYPPSNLISFGIQYGRVDLHSATRILPLGWQTSVLFDHVKLTSNTIMYNGHLGLQMVGQYHNITNCIFEYGKYGIHYIATLGRNDFYASDCIFRYCDEGLYTDDKGAHLTRCNFKNNTILGWNTGVMSNPSDADEGVVGGSIPNANKQGYYYYANNAAPLTLTDPNITYNNTSGVQVERTLMLAKCGTISYNINEGILLGKASTLQMDNGSNVTCVGNAFSIGLVQANYLFLYKGNNDLTPLQPLNHTAVAGTLIAPGPYPILADMNKWSSGGFGWLDFSILHNGIAVSMTDWNPQTFIDPCGQAIPPPPPAGQEDPLTHCDECDLINTDDFSNEKLNDATRTALDKAQDNSAENYIEAADMFSQILMEDYINPSNKEKYLLTLNYLKMLDALGNAFGSGQLTWQTDTSVIDTITQKVIGVLNKLIDIAVNGNDYTGRLIYSIDKASVYRLADRRDLALGVLYSISNWIGQDDADELSRLECIYDLENQALLGSIPPEELFYAINSCGAAQEQRRGNFATATSPNTPEDMMVNIYPSPASTEITLVTNVEHGEESLMNSIGQKVYCGTFSNEDVIDVGNLQKGIYSLEITDKEKGKKKMTRIVIQ